MAHLDNEESAMLDDPFEELKAEVAELLRASICIVDTYKREAALSIKSKLFSVFTGIVMGLIAVALLYSAASMFLHSLSSLLQAYTELNEPISSLLVSTSFFALLFLGLLYSKKVFLDCSRKEPKDTDMRFH